MSTHIYGSDLESIADNSPRFLDVTATARTLVSSPVNKEVDSTDFEESMLPLDGPARSQSKMPFLNIPAGSEGKLNINLAMQGLINNHWYSMGEMVDFSYQFDWQYKCTADGIISLINQPAPVKRNKKGPLDITLDIRKWDVGEKPNLRILIGLALASGQGAISVEFHGVGASTSGTTSGDLLLPLQINLGVIGAVAQKKSDAPWLSHFVYFNVGKSEIDARVEEPNKKMVDEGQALDEWCKKVRKALDQNPDWEEVIRSNKVPVNVTGFASKTWKNKSPQEIRALNFQLSKDRAKKVADRVANIVRLPINIVESTGQGMAQAAADGEAVNERVCKVWVDGDKLTKQLENLRASRH